MKSLDKIPTSKIQRASKIVGVGAKVGVNYLKYYGQKLTGDADKAKANLDENNATDIYDGLSQLKGSALKMAQMMSMDQSILPKAYVDKFSLAQFSVPPLSAPLVRKTFFKTLGKYPEDIFDDFDVESSFAASIGQVHRARIGDQLFAVKIQYPGVADSISSDLALVKPFALRMFNMKSKDVERYFKEIESKLYEETNYTLEVEQSTEIASQCTQIHNLRFPKMFPEYSSDRIITMEWMDGKHLSELTEQNTDKEAANKISQTLWDFYMFQFHQLGIMHADPHPGNFLVNKEGELVVLDFGCTKVIPSNFYKPFNDLMQQENIENDVRFEDLLWELQIFSKEDTEEQKNIVRSIFKKMLTLLCAPFNVNEFDFSNSDFFTELAKMGDKMSKNKEIRTMSGNRGSEHFLYVNRTFFGLFSLLSQLNGGKIRTSKV
jgi:predicted unusual protein kinase regulating ubiquinone biosynthesis (AarF/ABC1/UbiB family)|tara:strand:+ start:18157 stop:19458 length:1302 start_codon:yes stop_codon:yes gene_type:complete